MQVDEADARFDLQHLLLHSAFSLLADVSAFNGVVCSGSIPVMMSHDWVRPFEGFTNFETYGLQLRGGLALPDLIDTLEQEVVDEAKMYVLRGNARALCNRALQSYEVQASAILEAFANPTRAIEPRQHAIQQTLHCKDRIMLLSNNMLYRASETSSHSLTRNWYMVSPGPYIWLTAYRDVVFAVYSDYMVYKFPTVLRKVWRHSKWKNPAWKWELAADGSVTAIAISEGIMYGIGLDDNMYYQALDSMTPQSHWAPVGLSKPMPLQGLASLQGTIYGAHDNRIYVLNLTGRHWDLSARQSRVVARDLLPGAGQVHTKDFLRDIGYLIPDKGPVSVTTQFVDEEIAKVPAPQLVVPSDNARYVLNAVNARWGSLYDALYGFDVIPAYSVTSSGVEINAAKGSSGEAVIDFANGLLDEIAPLVHGKWGDVCRLWPKFVGSVPPETETMTPSLFVGSQGNLGPPDADVARPQPSSPCVPDQGRIFLKHNGLHMILEIDRTHPIGKAALSGIKDSYRGRFCTREMATGMHNTHCRD
eukprot:s3621_g3.t1